MKKIIAFTPADNNNLKHFEKMKNSLRKFHSEEDLPLLLIDEKKIATYNDPMFFYRATPIIAKELLAEYQTVVKLDADQIICAPILDQLEGEYDVAVVNNSSPQEFKTYPYQFLNINPLSYVNCGFVVMKSKAFVNEWYDNCFSMLFNGFQMKEQDFLNLLVHSNHYKVKRLDEGDSFFGLASKGYWPEVQLKPIPVKDENGAHQEQVLFLPKGEEWPDKDKTIRVIHFAGGNDPNKGNFRIHFQPEVIKKLEKLIK